MNGPAGQVPKLYLNHDVHKTAAEILHREGHDVVATVEVGKEIPSDEEQLAYARGQERAISAEASRAEALDAGAEFMHIDAYENNFEHRG